MPWGAIAAAVAPTVVSSLLGGGGGGGAAYGGGGYSGPPVYTPSSLPYAEQSWRRLLDNVATPAGNLPSSVDPILLASLNNQLGINYQPLIGAGQTAGAQYGNLANVYGNVGQNALNQAQQAYGAGTGVLNTAFDPQSALYNLMQQQTMDKANLINSMYGLGSSPAGASVANQAMTNFGIDWQNQQLARQAQGITALGQANQIGGAQTQAGTGYLAQAPGATLQSAQVPISAMQAAYTAPATAATNYAAGVGTAITPAQSIMGSIIPFMNYGTGAQSTLANQAALANQAQSQQNAAQTRAIAGLTSNVMNIPGVQNWMGSLFGTGGGYNPSSGQAPMSAADMAAMQTWGGY